MMVETFPNNAQELDDESLWNSICPRRNDSQDSLFFSSAPPGVVRSFSSSSLFGSGNSPAALETMLGEGSQSTPVVDQQHLAQPQILAQPISKLAEEQEHYDEQCSDQQQQQQRQQIPAHQNEEHRRKRRECDEVVFVESLSPGSSSVSSGSTEALYSATTVSTYSEDAYDESKRAKSGGKYMQRVQSACDACRQRKQRCNGVQPCDRCTRLGLFCMTSERKKPGRKPTNKKADSSAVLSKENTVASSVTTVALSKKSTALVPKNASLHIATQEFNLSCASSRAYFLSLYHEYLDPLYEIKTHLRQYQDPLVRVANSAVDSQVNSAVAMAARASGHRPLAEMAISRAQELSRSFYDDPSEESVTAFFLMATYYSGQDRTKALFCARQAKNLLDMGSRSVPSQIRELARSSPFHELMEVTYLTLQEDSRQKHLYEIYVPVVFRCLKAIGNPSRFFLHYLQKFNPPGFLYGFAEDLPYTRNLSEQQYTTLSTDMRNTAEQLANGENVKLVQFHYMLQALLAIRAGKVDICIESMQAALSLFGIATEFLPGKFISKMFCLCEICIELDRKDLLSQVGVLFKRLASVYDLAETVHIAIMSLLSTTDSLKAPFRDLDPPIDPVVEDVLELNSRSYSDDFFEIMD